MSRTHTHFSPMLNDKKGNAEPALIKGQGSSQGDDDGEGQSAVSQSGVIFRKTTTPFAYSLTYY